MVRSFKKKSQKSGGAKRKKGRGAFSGLGGVRGSFEKQNMLPGRYTGMIEKVIQGERQVDHEPFIAIRLVVLKVHEDGQRLVLQGVTQPGLEVGANPAHIIIKNSQYDYHLRDLKNFLITALDQDDDAIEEISGQIWNCLQSDQDLPAELSEYAEYVEDAECLEDVIDGVWDHTRDYATSEENPLAGFLVEWNSTCRVKKSARDVDEDKLTAEHYVTNTVYRRSVSFSEAAKILDDDGMQVLLQHVPDLEDRIAAEADED